MVEFTARSGAKPYDQRREEIDEEREAKGDLPIPDEEFLTLVYDPTEPAVKELQEKMKKVRAELTPEFNSPTDEPLSPRTQREIQRKNDLIVTVEARAPKKGKVILHPQETLAELVGGHEAVRFIKKRKVEDSHVVVGVPDGIYSMMSTILDQVRQMVRSLPMREVKKFVLDEEVHYLATAEFPDPSQHSMHNHYVRAANGLLGQILKDNDKIIIEETLTEKAVVLGSTCDIEDEDPNNNEDEDREAHNFPLF
ncbi:hypothetical protein POM88_020400 [Heracleum sosnowskyi]|uniref:Uncharacterized protein n=1 Tax=Heracleum sosnowskyi TaxID=360622 RepID=A0AAD8MN25_9APIA|nr:hypothetical protein POM88_020400 [Heracleum sosnowskyi]